MRYSWEREGHWTAFSYSVRDRQEGMIGRSLANCRDAYSAERIVEALNAWDTAKSYAKSVTRKPVSSTPAAARPA